MISSELLKGSLKPIVMKLLAEQKKIYGYEITQRVEELTQGKIKLTFGALYPILHKLEQDGFVETESEVVNNRNRIYYKLTRPGKATAKEKVLELNEFVEVMRQFLNPQPGFSPCIS
jgi:DNA-binding PadR family transcriptional regulator